MKHLRSFFLLLFCSAIFLTPLFAQDSGSTTTTSKTKTTVTHNADGSTTTTTTNPDGSTTAITTGKPDGTRIVDTAKIGGPWTTTTDYPDGSSIEYINNADGSSVKIVENADGTWTKTTTSAKGKITITSGGSGSSSGAPSSTPNPGSSPGATPTGSSTSTASASPDPGSSATPDSSASPDPNSSATPDSSASPDSSATPTPDPTPTPSTPVAAPFYIDRDCITFSQEDPNNCAYISASCITADQWAAFLNAVAKYSDAHQLYWPAMGNLPQATKDAAGNVIPAPKMAQIVRTLSADQKSLVYSVVNRDNSAAIPGAVEMKNKDLPITYISLLDAARFCNWLHHGEPIVQSSSEDPDDYTEGGAYLLDDGLNKYYQSTHQGLIGYQEQYLEELTLITLLPDALWKIPSYYDYNGVHHLAGSNQNTPDFTEPGNEFSDQPIPTEERNGFFDNGYTDWLGPYSHYQWTSTHSSASPSQATLHHCDPQNIGSYYKVKTSSDSVLEYAASFIGNNFRNVDKSQDNDTSFRVMPLGAAITEPSPTPSPSPSPSASASPDNSPDAPPDASSSSSPDSSSSSSPDSSSH